MRRNNGDTHWMPRYCSYNTPIVSVSCGAEHALLMTQGCIYSMGRNIEGQLGIGSPSNGLDPIKQKNAPVLIENIGICKPAAVAAGAFHSMCIMSNGEIYSWGKGEGGCLGIGTTKNQFLPVLVEFHEPLYPFIKSLSAGNSHSLALDNQGRAYSFGSNQYGQLGIGCSSDPETKGKLLSKSTPARIKSVTDQIISIAAGGNHSLICTKAGRIYSCGDNSKGQLGTGDKRSSGAFIQLKDMDGIKVSEVEAGNQHSA